MRSCVPLASINRIYIFYKVWFLFYEICVCIVFRNVYMYRRRKTLCACWWKSTSYMKNKNVFIYPSTIKNLFLYADTYLIQWTFRFQKMHMTYHHYRDFVFWQILKRIWPIIVLKRIFIFQRRFFRNDCLRALTLYVFVTIRFMDIFKRRFVICVKYRLIHRVITHLWAKQ